jgi:hypothetical protein
MNAASSPLGIFGHRNYALYVLGNTISSLGMWAQRVGVGWLSWELSHAATWVGLAPLFGGLWISSALAVWIVRHAYRAEVLAPQK